MWSEDKFTDFLIRYRATVANSEDCAKPNLSVDDHDMITLTNIKVGDLKAILLAAKLGQDKQIGDIKKDLVNHTRFSQDITTLLDETYVILLLRAAIEVENVIEALYNSMYKALESNDETVD